MKFSLLFAIVFALPQNGSTCPAPGSGFTPGTEGDTRDRRGPTGINVPGRCPPEDSIIEGQAFSKGAFPCGTDLESRIRRYEITLSALQDLKCPASSTTMLGRLRSLTALRSNPNANEILAGLGINDTPAGNAPQAPPPSTPEPSSQPQPSTSGRASLVPFTGFPAGNEGDTRDRRGPTGINVPGRCPPTHDRIVAQVLQRRPDFPTGADLASRIIRYETTLSALQDLKCPASSTTMLGRLRSLTALRSNPNSDQILAGLGINDTPAGPNVSA